MIMIFKTFLSAGLTYADLISSKTDFNFFKTDFENNFFIPGEQYTAIDAYLTKEPRKF